MAGREIPPPPSATPQGGSDPRNTRHSCGFAYNRFRWSECPACRAEETGLFAMGCVACRATFWTAEPENMCPECGSGETTTVAAPETPAVR